MESVEPNLMPEWNSPKSLKLDANLASIVGFRLLQICASRLAPRANLRFAKFETILSLGPRYDSLSNQ